MYQLVARLAADLNHCAFFFVTFFSTSMLQHNLLGQIFMPCLLSDCAMVLATFSSTTGCGYGSKYAPYVIEPSAGLDRGVLAILSDVDCREQHEDGKERIVLKIKPSLAPIKAAVIICKH